MKELGKCTTDIEGKDTLYQIEMHDTMPLVATSWSSGVVHITNWNTGYTKQYWRSLKTPVSSMMFVGDTLMCGTGGGKLVPIEYKKSDEEQKLDEYNLPEIHNDTINYITKIGDSWYTAGAGLDIFRYTDIRDIATVAPMKYAYNKNVTEAKYPVHSIIGIEEVADGLLVVERSGWISTHQADTFEVVRKQKVSEERINGYTLTKKGIMLVTDRHVMDYDYARGGSQEVKTRKLRKESFRTAGDHLNEQIYYIERDNMGTEIYGAQTSFMKVGATGQPQKIGNCSVESVVGISRDNKKLVVVESERMNGKITVFDNPMTLAIKSYPMELY